MWFFTKYGMFSIVQDDGRGAREGSPEQRHSYRFVIVRARAREHLERLQQVFEQHVRPGKPFPEIVYLGGADYRYRARMHRQDWRMCVEFFCRQDVLDYPNFKDAAAGVSDNDEYVEALHAVWETYRSSME